MLSYFHDPSMFILFTVDIWNSWKNVVLEKDHGGHSVLPSLCIILHGWRGGGGEFEQITLKLGLSIKDNNYWLQNKFHRVGFYYKSNLDRGLGDLWTSRSRP